ncbi:MAG: hypothetical protein ABS75_24800 [Pelagibacterium sp. SCN 63-23]|nr:MAG: hypothetical protein ABS75_24800 [Pelagibacterium sp. SCN 63-23]
MKKRAAAAIGLLKTVLAIVLIGLVLTSCVNIVLRYVFKLNWIAADELQVFVMIALAFVGTIVVSAEGRQLRLDLLGQIPSPLLQTVLSILESLVATLVCGFVAYHSWAFLMRAFAMGQKGGSSGVPMWIPHSTVTICFAALTLLALVTLVRKILSLGASARNAK